jgi:hypothetical protein
MTTGGDILFNVTLRVFHESLDPDVVSLITSCEPTDSFRKGDAVGTHGAAAAAVRKYGYWGYCRSGVSRVDLSSAVREVAAIVPPAALHAGPLAAYEMDVWISSTEMRGDNNGFQLDAAALEALAVRRWPVVFDLYFAPE